MMVNSSIHDTMIMKAVVVHHVVVGCTFASRLEKRQVTQVQVIGALFVVVIDNGPPIRTHRRTSKISDISHFP